MKIEVFCFQELRTIPPQNIHNENARLQTTQTNKQTTKTYSNGFSKKCSYGTRRGAEGEGGRKKYLG